MIVSMIVLDRPIRLLQSSRCIDYTHRRPIVSRMTFLNSCSSQSRCATNQTHYFLWLEYSFPILAIFEL
jgi:hypothetical protein